jgi:hypothetical protein
MCIKSRKLSLMKLKEHSLYLDQMRIEGLDIGEGLDSLGSWADPCALELKRSGSYGFVCDYPPGNFVIAVPLRIAVSQRTTVVECRIEALWEGYTIFPASLRAYRGTYYLGPLSYPADEVLNGHFENWFALSQGQVLEGVVLACGWGQLPKGLASGSLPVRVSLTDDLDREASLQLKLMVKSAGTGSAVRPISSAADSLVDHGVQVDVAETRMAVRSMAIARITRTRNQT